MARLWEECRGFVPLRELLAWNLAKLGHEEQAQLHFEALAADEKDAEVRASALLGLGCLANRRFGHRQSAARVHAAVSATPIPQAQPSCKRSEAEPAAATAAKSHAAHAQPPPQPPSLPQPPPGLPRIGSIRGEPTGRVLGKVVSEEEDASLGFRHEGTGPSARR